MWRAKGEGELIVACLSKAGGCVCRHMSAQVDVCGRYTPSAPRAWHMRVSWRFLTAV
jgi:hypothetical protein